MAGVISTKAQDGNYKVSESWSVTVYDPYDNRVFTKTGKKSGSITVSNGSYQLVNTTGTGVGSLDGTIQYDGNQYTVNARPVLYAFAQKGTDLYAVVKLSFFVVLVPLPSTFGFSLFQEDDEYTATGFSSDLQGSGTAIDGNDERWDVSSTASFNTLVAQKFTIVVSALPSNGGSATGGGAFAAGSSRTVKAMPGSGYLFADWTEGGVVVSTSNPYAFTLNADCNLVANFVPSPFIPVKGTYNGLFYEAGGVLHQSSGCFTLATTVKGTFSGSLIAGGTRYSLSGQLDANGDAQVTLARGNLSSLTVVLHLDLTQGTDQITGTVSDGTWTAALSGDRAVYDGKTSIAPLAGNKYTLILPGSNDSTTEPGGDGYGTLTVDGTGKIHLAGSLSDGTKISQVGALSKYGEWPFYVPLYSGQGSVLSWIAFVGTATNDLSGDLTWTKPGMVAKYYPGGFRVETAAWGSLYTPPATGQRVLNFTEADVVLSGGNLAQGITNPIALGPANKVTSTNKTSLTFTLPTGLFKGSVLNPVTLKPIPFYGVALQKTNIGCGYFLGTSQSGRVQLQGP